MLFLNEYHFAKRGYQLPFAYPFLLLQRSMILLQWVGCAWFRKIQQLFNDCIIYYVDVLLNFLKQTVLVTDWWQLTTCHIRQKQENFYFRLIISKFCMNECWENHTLLNNIHLQFTAFYIYLLDQ